MSTQFRIMGSFFTATCVWVLSWTVLSLYYVLDGAGWNFGCALFWKALGGQSPPEIDESGWSKC